MENNEGAFTRLDDEACGKLWEIYLSEAERYDEGLVSSWKDDMDVILVFSGLYSAVLTAFVIESYRNLQPDPAEQSVTLLLHLSGQLASFGNTSAPTSEAAVLEGFSAPVPAVACNVLWFLSLSLALSCAFLATFVQQWTRQFLHRTTILRSPTARAYLFSFLYFGLKDYGMHTIVDIIPSLLHLSLFAFFAGLVAFLHPINSAVQWLIVGTLIAITCIYTGFTIMPVFTLNSPFQTPLSPMVWRIWQLVSSVFCGALVSLKHFSFRTVLKTFKNTSMTERELPTTAPDTKRPHSSLTDAMVVASHQHRQDREWMSLVWTLRSLNDDTELLPFVEALPNVLYSLEHGIHSGNIHLLKPLLETTDPQIDIIARVDAMMINSSHPWFSDGHRQRCQTACPKALWTIAYVLKLHPGQFELSKTQRLSWFRPSLLDKLNSEELSGPLDKNYAIPANALIRSNIISCAETFLQSMLSPSPSTSSSSPPRFPIPYKDFAIFVSYDLLRTWRDGEDSYQLLQETTSIDRSVANGLLKQCAIEHMAILTDFLQTSTTAPSTLTHPTHKALLPVGKGWPDLIGYTFPGVFSSLLTQLRACLLHPGSDAEVQISGLDQIFRAALETISEIDGLLAAKYIETRVLKSIIGNTATLKIWSHETIFFFLQAAKKIVKDQSCLMAVREVVCCSRHLPSIYQGDPACDPQPLWIEILNSLQPSESETPASFEHSWTLSTLIKIMILQEPPWADPNDPDAKRLDMAAFVTRYIHPSIQQSQRGDRTPFLPLISEVLEALDSPDYPKASQSDALTILDHIGHYRVFGAVYGADVMLLHQLALATKSLCEKWRNAPSENLLSILEFVWNMWDTGEHLKNGGALWGKEGDPEITGRVVQTIWDAAKILKDTEEQLKEIAQSRKEVTGIGGTGGLIRYHLVMHLHYTFDLWEKIFPYMLPLPPPTPTESTCLDLVYGEDDMPTRT